MSSTINDGGAVRNTWVYAKVIDGVTVKDWGLPSESDMRRVVDYSNDHGNTLGTNDYWTSTESGNRVVLMNGSTSFTFLDIDCNYNSLKLRT